MCMLVQIRTLAALLYKKNSKAVGLWVFIQLRQTYLSVLPVQGMFLEKVIRLRDPSN